jgi:hypothetical protein
VHNGGERSDARHDETVGSEHLFAVGGELDHRPGALESLCG